MKSLNTLSFAILFPCLPFVAASAATPVTPASTTAAVAASPASPVSAFGRRYLDGLFAAKPHLASFMGAHEFDDRWPDWSPAGVSARATQIRGQLTELEKLASSATNTDDTIDLEVIRDALQLELLQLTEIKEYSWDPRINDSFPPYDPREVVADRLVGLVRGVQPRADRLRALTRRLERLPAFLKQLQGQLQRPARVYTERAIGDNKGRIDTVNGEVKTFIASFSTPAESAARKQAEAALSQALSGLQEYQRFLQSTLLPRSDGDFKLGAALFRKKYPLSLGTRLTPDQVVARAEAAVQKSRADLFVVARRLHAQLFPKLPQPAANADKKQQVQTIAAVRAELVKEHPNADELVASHGRDLKSLRSFITDKQLLTLPPEETLRVEAMPPFKRGVSGAEYLSPDVLDPRPSWSSTYYVDPIDSSLPREKIESMLRADNFYEVRLVAMHEAYPGHHTQYFYSKRNFNPVRAVLWNGPMVEGWAVYATTLLTREGFGGKDNDKYRFFDLLGAIRVAHNAILDAKLQEGHFSDGEAVKMMVEEGFQEPAAAEKKLLRAKLDSTQLSQYFLGLSEIEELERDARKQAAARGQTWDQRAFNEALIGHGSVAVGFLRRFVVKEETGIKK